MDLKLKEYKNRHSLKSKIGRVVWNIVWLILFRPTPRGSVFRLWRTFLLKLFGAKIAWSCDILPTCRIWQPWNLSMGKYSCLGMDVDCYSVDRVIIGDNVTVSQGTKLCTASHDIASLNMELTTNKIVLGNNVWIAGWAIVLPGITIGDWSIVAAGSVVIDDVEPWTVVGGNPAKFIKKRELKV